MISDGRSSRVLLDLLVSKFRCVCFICINASSRAFFVDSGTAVVTTMKAALWTDGRYFLQAESQLDGNWLLMRDGSNLKALMRVGHSSFLYLWLLGLPSTPKIGEWLCQVNYVVITVCFAHISVFSLPLHRS